MWRTQPSTINNLVHVLPVKDIKSHIEEGKYCPCKPRVDGGVVIHNAFDAREFYEINPEVTVTSRENRGH